MLFFRAGPDKERHVLNSKEPQVYLKRKIVYLKKVLAEVFRSCYVNQ